ncbi:phenylacetate--CoA ligase family protein, partial [Bacteroidota bacterium]
ELLAYLNYNSKFYKDLFNKHKIDFKKIKTLEDLTYLPVTTKNDLQKRNKDFLCVDEVEIIDYLSTSGTLGDPVIFAMTNNDLDRLAYNEYISFSCADATKNDIFQLMVTMDMRFMAGMAYYLGIRKLGAGIVRVGPGNPELQFDTINRISPTAFITVPSFIIKLIEYAEKHNFDLNKTSIKKAVCIGESIRKEDFKLNTLGRKIKDQWDIKLYSTYASTEMGTAFTECTEGIGGHHHPEIIIVEFLDDKNQAVKEGEPGEVTITNIGVQGMPLLRFKTGDICHFHTEACKCGRNTMRLGPVIGRRQQMIKYKGTTLYPPSLYDILNDIQGVENYIVEVSTNELGTDDILINVGSKIQNNRFEKEIKDYFRAKIRVAPTIQFMQPAEITKLQFTENSRKPITFIDNRTNR